MLQHSEELKTPEEMFSPHVAQKLQRELSEMYSKFRRTQWREAAELKDKARLDSASGKEAAAWVTALPKHYSSKVEPRTFRTMVSYRSEEHTSELQSLMRISYAVFCLKQTTSNP